MRERVPRPHESRCHFISGRDPQGVLELDVIFVMHGGEARVSVCEEREMLQTQLGSVNIR